MPQTYSRATSIGVLVTSAPLRVSWRRSSGAGPPIEGTSGPDQLRMLPRVSAWSQRPVASGGPNDGGTMGVVIIDCAIYRKGHREETSHDPAALADVIAGLAETDGFLWIGLYEPSLEELTQFAGPLNLHPLAVEDAVEAHQRPKVERYDAHLFMSIKTVTYTNDNIETAEINAFLGQRYLVTVRHGHGHDLR